MNHSSIPSSLRPSALMTAIFIMVTAAIILLPGCTNKDGSFGGSGKGKDFSCVKLTRKQIQDWVDKGFISNENRSSFRLRFRAAYAFPGKGFVVFAGLEGKDGKLIEASLVRLSPVDTCSATHSKISPYTLYSMLQYSSDSWNIWDDQGKLRKDFDHVRFDPYDFWYKTMPYLALNDYVTNSDGSITTSTTTMLVGPLPCPPCENCKLPCPEFCTTCGPTTDSLPPSDSLPNLEPKTNE